MSLSGFAYATFGWAGKSLLKMIPGLEEDIRASGLNIYPEAYASLVVFFGFLGFIIGLIIGAPVLIISLLHLVPFLPFTSGIIISFLSFFAIPLLLFGIAFIYPKLKRVSRGSKLDLEVPYLAAYITTMATGGISPYISIERLATAPKILFDEMRKEAKKFYLRVRAMGEDPLTAIEISAREIPNKEYKELMFGYASTLRVGGDVVHFLQRQTEMLLKERVSQVRAVAERIAMLMESYMAIALLTSLVMYTLFVVNMALAQAGFAISGSASQFVMFAYIILPLISGMFIYLADIMQPKYPIYDISPYKVYFGVSLPITVFLGFVTAVPHIAQGTLIGYILMNNFKPILDVFAKMSSALGLPKGFEAGFNISLSLIIGVIPSVLAHIRSTLVHGGVQHGVTVFLRDLVEVRKTGLSPERCIMNLANREYGRFSKHLKVMAKQVGWGIPLHRIFERFAEKVKNWLALITIYLLVESIEVGGGTPETLESLANYSETLEFLDREKRRMLRPLILIPYIGAIIIVIVVLILIGFMNRIMQLAHMGLATQMMINMFLPPVIINSYLMGLVAGKISSERVSAGFIHALLLTLASIFAMIITPSMVSGFLMPIEF